LKKIKSLRKQALEKKEQTACAEVDKIFDIYHDHLLPKCQSAILARTGTLCFTERVLKNADLADKDLAIIEEKLKLQLIKEELQHEFDLT